jgi:Zn-dependent peptidase ImmA (M78 family)
MLVRDAARQAAERVRAEHWDGTFPVDPVSIARALDLEVKFTSMLPGISGAIVVRPDTAQVLIEDTEAYGRKMFTCAHEVGHYLERQAQNDRSYSFVEKRGGEYDLHEFYADEFAGALLMPAAEFQKQERLLGSDFLMASYFGVSPSAVQKRRERLAR